MKKKIFYATISLILLSTIAKILSFIVRIYLARTLSLEAMNLYSLAMPTLVFLIALAQMGIPTALSKVIAQSVNPLNGILSSFILSLINNLILITLFLIMIPFLSTHLFKDIQISSILKSMVFMIPMVTLSGLCKAILQGKQHHAIACASQIFEEVFRIIFLIIGFSLFLKDARSLATTAMFSVFVGECGSTLFMLAFLFIKKHPLKRRQHDLKKEHFLEILSLSVPMTSARLIGSLTYFLEPIIFLAFADPVLLKNAYGIFNGYVLPLLTMPSFISVTLASALLPTFVYEKKHNHLEKAKKIFYMMSLICLLISLTCALTTYFFPSEILQLFYKTKEGSAFLKNSSLPFIFYSLQPVLSSILHALDQSKKALIDTLLGCLLRLAILALLTPLLQENTLILAIVASMLTTTFLHALRVCWSLKKLSLTSK
ncbi:oligosaccharide flippase family protein [uncultured Traorella sp.]|uniref:oligosaccharide flippase family protein n=1 Tax=uncultured Traorella sp. TaxID=1929048 RepID=UPI0025DD0245|nr:oligosaccharide flippase family protein [uncultured Traorella sp.]